MIKEIPTKGISRAVDAGPCAPMRGLGFNTQCYCTDENGGHGCPVCIYDGITQKQADELKVMKPFTGFKEYTDD